MEMNKQNRRNLTLFLIRESLAYLSKKSQSGTQWIEDSDLTRQLQNEAESQRLADLLALDSDACEGTKGLVDQPTVLGIIDVLENVGLVTKRLDSNMTTRYVTWHGFSKVGEKYGHSIVKTGEGEG